ncbi:MAG: RNA polymerase sigma factor [Schleiferiaceae bacterium]|nr:RNA polymerase sigma factor [Schleiferiaceae bacterium]
MKILRLQPSETQLITKCKKGDRKSQHELYQKMAKKMMGVSRRYTRSTEEAEEILSNGFIKVFKNIAQFEGKGSFEGWVRKIIVNEAINYIRYKKNLFVEAEDDWFEPSHEQLNEQNDAQEILAMIDQLPVGYKTVFNLYAIEGYPHKEISEMLGISEGTSKSQLSKARRLLQDRISGLNLMHKS